MKVRDSPSGVQLLFNPTGPTPPVPLALAPLQLRAEVQQLGGLGAAAVGERIQACLQDPFEGIGKPEPLRENPNPSIGASRLCPPHTWARG